MRRLIIPSLINNLKLMTDSGKGCESSLAETVEENDGFHGEYQRRALNFYFNGKNGGIVQYYQDVHASIRKYFLKGTFVEAVDTAGNRRGIFKILAEGASEYAMEVLEHSVTAYNKIHGLDLYKMKSFIPKGVQVNENLKGRHYFNKFDDSREPDKVWDIIREHRAEKNKKISLTPDSAIHLLKALKGTR